MTSATHEKTRAKKSGGKRKLRVINPLITTSSYSPVEAGFDSVEGAGFETESVL